jgi:hypothetical protein
MFGQLSYPEPYPRIAGEEGVGFGRDASAISIVARMRCLTRARAKAELQRLVLVRS